MKFKVRNLWKSCKLPFKKSDNLQKKLCLSSEFKLFQKIKKRLLKSILHKYCVQYLVKHFYEVYLYILLYYLNKNQ